MTDPTKLQLTLTAQAPQASAVTEVQGVGRSLIGSNFLLKPLGHNLAGPSLGERPVFQGSFKKVSAVTPTTVYLSFHVHPSIEALNAAKEALHGLIDSRDFLGFQLSRANGCMGEDTFESIAEKYLQHTERSAEDLARLTEGLVMLLGERVDSDIVSAAFKADLDDAERALSSVAKRIASFHARQLNRTGVDG